MNPFLQLIVGEKKFILIFKHYFNFHNNTILKHKSNSWCPTTESIGIVLAATSNIYVFVVCITASKFFLGADNIIYKSLRASISSLNLAMAVLGRERNNLTPPFIEASTYEVGGKSTHIHTLSCSMARLSCSLIPSSQNLHFPGNLVASNLLKPWLQHQL